MELFLPGIASLLIIGLLVFLILPRIGAPVLAILSIFLLAYGIMNHMQLFAAEWRYSTWFERFRYYGPIIIIVTMILGALMYMAFLYQTKGADALPASNVPVANAAEVVNAVNEAVTNAVNAANEAVVNATNQAAKAVNNTVNAAVNAVNGRPTNNREGILTNLGNILKTPRNNQRRY